MTELMESPGSRSVDPKTASRTPLNTIARATAKMAFVAQEPDDGAIQAEAHEDWEADHDDGEIGRPIFGIHHGSAGFQTQCRPKGKRYRDGIRADGDEAFG